MQGIVIFCQSQEWGAPFFNSDLSRGSTLTWAWCGGGADLLPSMPILQIGIPTNFY
jgi:hypothetical protein